MVAWLLIGLLVFMIFCIHEEPLTSMDAFHCTKGSDYSNVPHTKKKRRFFKKVLIIFKGVPGENGLIAQIMLDTLNSKTEYLTPVINLTI